MADYEATRDLIGKLKHGQMLTIQAINLAGSAISLPLPLDDRFHESCHFGGFIPAVWIPI